MRRLLAAAALAAIGLSATVPLASGHYDDRDYPGPKHVLDWQNKDRPSPSTTAENGKAVLMDEVVSAYAFFADGVKSWDVAIRPVNGGQPSTCHEDLAQNPKSKNSYPTEVYINCPWNTAMATNHTLPQPTPADQASQPVSPRVWQSQDLGPAVNGKYTIEISVWNAGQTCGLITDCVPHEDRQEPHCLADTGYAACKQGDPTPAWRSVFVVNKPVAPGAVSSVFDRTTNSISVTWPANPEPDVSYVVQEKVGDGKWSSGVGVPANRYERPLDQPGKYQFQVAAVRPAPTRSNDRATERSAFTAAGPTDVPQLTPPSTAGGPNGADGAPGGGGGDQGVFTPTDPTSPTQVTAGGRATPGKSNGRSPARPSGSSSRPGTTAHQSGEEEGEGPDYGFSTQLPYNTDPGDPEFAEDDGLADEGEPEMLAGGVVPKPRDTRQLMVFMAGALTLFVFAMQITFMLRRTRPAATTAATQTYHDDFDDWLGF